MFDGTAEIVIQGVTAAGEKFRPSDWAERLCGMMSVFGEDRQLSYSPYLKPATVDGIVSVWWWTATWKGWTAQRTIF